ncbi:MAG: cupredoxin family protein [Rubrivivax sp.]|nr:cupredoxin family protein [Rubrivivax sp.]
MPATKRTLLLAGVAVALGAARQAAAHGDKEHRKPAAVRKEQKPWGIAGDARSVKRTIEVRMLDHMRFEPDRIDVRLGETIRFVHRNTGKVMHEFVIGTRKELEEHAALMLKHPNMEHDEPYMAHVAPGKTAEMIWTFNRAGTFEFACLIAGHFQAGMVGRIDVRPA